MSVEQGLADSGDGLGSLDGLAGYCGGFPFDCECCSEFGGTTPLRPCLNSKLCPLCWEVMTFDEEKRVYSCKHCSYVESVG